MKKIKIFLLMLFSCAAILTAEDAKLNLYPVPARPGETVEYIVTAEKAIPAEPALPALDGGRWLSGFSSSGISIVNFKTTHTRTFRLIPEKTGTLTIPAWQFKAGKKRIRVPEYQLKVTAGNEPAARNRGVVQEDRHAAEPAGEILLPDSRRKFYVGEEIPMTVRLLLPLTLPVRELGYPQLAGSGLLFRRSADQPNQKFDRPREKIVAEKGKQFREYRFNTSFRVLTPGPVKLTGTVPMVIAERLRSRRSDSPFGTFFDDDDFFSFGGSRNRRLDLTLESSPEIEALPLPPRPQGTIDGNLIGSWKISATFDRREVRAGEPLTLLLRAVGTGSTDGLRMPRLEFAGARVYPPEVTRKNNSLEIRYAVIPLKPGKFSPRFTLALFDTAKGKYELYTPDLTVEVQPGEKSVPSAVSDLSIPEKTTEIETPRTPAPERDELFYQRTVLDPGVRLPLWENHKLLFLLTLIVSPLAALILELFFRRRTKLAGDPEAAEQLRRRAKLKQLLGELNRCGTDDPDRIGELLRKAVELAAPAVGLSAGATPEELAGRIDDEELAELFRNCDRSQFCPGEARNSRAAISGKTLVKVRKFLKGCLLFTLFLPAIGPELHGGGLNDSFNAGKYQQSLREYQARLNPESPSPALCYNLGGAAFRCQDLPLARYWFTRAHLLSPRDNEFIENLNLVNRKLKEAQINAAGSPAELLRSCRDYFRPDEYLAIAAVCFALLCFSAALRRSIKSGFRITLFATLGALMLLSLIAAFSQSRQSYSRTAAIILAPEAELHSVPALGSGKVIATIPGGSSAVIRDRSTGWVRVEVNGQDGWMKADAVKEIFPEGIL